MVTFEMTAELIHVFTVIDLLVWTVYLIVRFIPSNMFMQSPESQGLGCPTME